MDSKSTALVASPKKRALAEGSEKPVEEEYLVAKLTSVAGAEQITPMPTATNVELMAFGKKPAKEPKEKKEPREKKAPKINLNDHCDPHLHIKVGGLIEVKQKEGTGYDGAWYAAQILELLPKAHFRVQYETIKYDGSDTLVEETVPMNRIRPRPPPNQEKLGASAELMHEHAVIFGNTEVGDHCEMPIWADGGRWR